METEINFFINYFFKIKQMEFMPEGCTPIEYDENPELIISWANKIAYINVTKASQIINNCTFESSAYTRYLQEFDRDLYAYKKALKKEIRKRI
jgi:hypothetical protein